MSTVSNVRLIKLLENIKKNDSENELLLELYKRHDKYTPESLVEKLRSDGSNTIISTFKGSVDYDEVVKRVAQKVNIATKDLTDDESKNELLIIQKTLQDYIKKNPDAKKKLEDVTKEIGVERKDFVNIILKGSAAAFLMAVQDIGAFMVWRTVAVIMMRFASIQAAFTVARVAALAVPFLNIAMSAWLVYDLSGPAYRKIVPSVFNIALLRLQAAGEAQSKTEPQAKPANVESVEARTASAEDDIIDPDEERVLKFIRDKAAFRTRFYLMNFFEVFPNYGAQEITNILSALVAKKKLECWSSGSNTTYGLKRA